MGKNKKDYPMEVHLTHVKGFAMISSDNETSHSIKGYYRDHTVASAATQGAGWYGGNGWVEEVDNLYTDGSRLFVLEPVSNPEYEKEEAILKAAQIEKIKSKLTPNEIELLGLNK